MRGAKPESSIEQAIVRDGIIRRGERVLVSCSGGADSVALAAALASVRSSLGLELVLAYAHHGTRRSAFQDECVVLRIGATFDIPVQVRQLNVDRADEATLRTARYDALGSIALTTGATVVATGHHREDQSETVLLALLRGTGPEGMAGMRPRRPMGNGIDLARPLLQAGAQELRHYCHVHALPYAVDPTNADGGLRRNAIRQALQALRPVFPGLDAAVARSAELAGAELEGNDRAATRQRVRTLLGAEDELRDVDFEHVEAAVRALERGSSGRFHMKAGVELEIARGAITIRKER